MVYLGGESEVGVLSTREITGSNREIAQQIETMRGRIVSAIVLVEEPGVDGARGPTDRELEELKREMERDTVAVPHADDSREAIYTRMPGE